MKLSKALFVLSGAALWLITLPTFADGTTLGEMSNAAHRSGDKSREALV